MTNLQALAQFASANNYNRSTTKIYELSIEEARAKVAVKDGNRNKAEDGSQALILGFGKRNLPLDAIAEGASRINAAADQVEEFTSVLRAAVDAGDFDGAILELQEAYKKDAEAAANKPAKAASEEVVAAPEVDLAELDELSV